MNSMFISVMAVLLGLLLNQSNAQLNWITGSWGRMAQDTNDVDLDLERATELYDAITDLITDQDEAVNCCQTRINNLANLLDDSFEQCLSGDSCMDKDAFLSDAKDHCNQYKDVEDFIQITDKSESYGSYSLSLSVRLIHLQMDDCKMTKTYDEVVTYNDAGLITKMVTSDHEETLNCPSYQQPTTTGKSSYGPAGGSYEPEPELPPVAVNDHVATDKNTPVVIDVLANDYDPNQPLGHRQDTLSIAQFTASSKGTVVKIGNKLTYEPKQDECGSDTFKYYITADNGLEGSADVHITIVCPPGPVYQQQNQYMREPAGNSYEVESTTDYNNGDESETRKLKNLEIDVPVEDPLYDGFTKVSDFEELEYVTADIVNLKNKISKNSAEIHLVEAYAKDIAEYRTTYRCELQYVGYPPDPVVLDDGSITQVGWIEYDVVDAMDEKNEKVRGCADGLGRALSLSKEDKVDDIDNKNKYCVDLVYEAVCHSDSCYMFKNSYNDRDSYLSLAKQYENMFDVATLEIEDDVLVLNYRKGQDPSCSGQFTQKVKIEYDEDRQCISKWIDYMDDIEMTDEDCGNSMAKLFEKIETQCKFDVESGGYDATEPAAGNSYGSELAPEANDDRLSVQQNEMTLLYVLANDKDPNHPELSGRDALDITAVTNGNKGEVHISPPSKRLRYIPNDGECGSDSFEYTVVNGAGLSDTATVYITINCDGYGTEPVLNLGYDDDKKGKIDEVMGKMGNIGCKSESDTFDDDDFKNEICVNIEYEAVCNNKDKCGSYAGSSKGIMAFLEVNRLYEDMFDEATITYKEDAFLVKYRKGSCSGYYDLRIVIETDSDNQCISKWTEYYDDLIISDEECEDSPDKFITKIQNECKYDDEDNDNNQYGDDKNEKLGEIMNKMGNIACKSKSDTFDDDDIQTKICMDIEYKAVCNDDYKCGTLAGEAHGKMEFLKLNGQYQDMFDEATITYEGDAFLVAYRKGLCSGHYDLKAEIDYDSERQCISKWTDYYDDLMLSDEVCENSADKWMNKIINECKYDDDNDNQYGEKIRKIMNKMGDITCKSKSDKFDDEDMKNAICLSIEYEGICNNEDKCGPFASKSTGREAFLEIGRKYEDMFDEATITYEHDSFLVEYRKGQDPSCSGYYDGRIVIELDSDNQCISKWTEYYDDLILSDKECEDSANKFINKIVNQCQYDDDNDVEYVPTLVTMERVDKTKILNSFYRAAFDCRLKKNQGNTQLLDTFMGYLSDSSRLCVMNNHNEETCYDKDEIRSMMSDRYVDDNEAIDYHIDITYNEGTTIEAKCTSRRQKSDGCIVIKEEYDTCVFNGDGSIKEFKVNRSNRETKCEEAAYGEEPADNSYEPEPNKPPVAVDDHVTTEKNIPVVIGVLDNDYDPNQSRLHRKDGLEITQFTVSSHGTVVKTGDKLTYKPKQDYCGSDTFTYYITAENGLEDSADVHIAIVCPPEPAYGQDEDAY